MLKTTTAPEPSASPRVRPGTAAYLRIAVALFLAGFATFSLLYCVQPLLVTFAATFRVSPTQSSLALSLTTGFLALSIMGFGAGSESLGRRGLMFMAMVGAAALNFAAALAPGWASLLALRALAGLALGGVPAVAMAYLAEEIDPRGLGLAMGLYVSGTAFGGMAGRVGVGLLSQATSWRGAMAGLSLLDLVAALGFVLLLPRSRHFTVKRGFVARDHRAAWAGHLRDPGLPLLFGVGFLVMGAFVTIYNYAAFRLEAAPYNLNPGQISLIFTAYLFGIAASSVAGALADRLGRGPVLIAGVLSAGLGVALTVAGSLACIIGGVILLTIGFFIAHSVASGWVGRLAKGAKGHASALYLLAYYLGSSLMGSAGGWFWGWGRWPAVAAFAGVMLFAALLAGLRLRRFDGPVAWRGSGAG